MRERFTGWLFIFGLYLGGSFFARIVVAADDLNYLIYTFDDMPIVILLFGSIVFFDIAFLVYLSLLYFRRKIKFLKIFQIFYLLAALLPISSLLLLAHVIGSNISEIPFRKTLIETAFNIIWLGIWQLYFLKSQVVKATFTK